MTKLKKREKVGFSVIDAILLVLAAVCILSSVFRTQIRDFLSNEEGVQIEYTFLVENVSEGAKNRPSVGEEIVLSKDLSSLGVLVQVAETSKIYQSQDDPQEKLEVTTLTCRARATVSETEKGYLLEGKSLKPGAEFSVQTESASFTMVVTMVKNANT